MLAWWGFFSRWKPSRRSLNMLLSWEEWAKGMVGIIILSLISLHFPSTILLFSLVVSFFCPLKLWFVLWIFRNLALWSDAAWRGLMINHFITLCLLFPWGFYAVFHVSSSSCKDVVRALCSLSCRSFSFRDAVVKILWQVKKEKCIWTYFSLLNKMFKFINAIICKCSSFFQAS